MYKQTPRGLYLSTELPSMDFETYSEAGYEFNPTTGKWKSLLKGKSGLAAVGGAVYAEHPSTEVICLAYDLKDNAGVRLWTPGAGAPEDLFDHIKHSPIAAWNSSFEFFIWHYVCVGKMGWPELPYTQLRCSMAKARGWALPGSLEKAAEVLNASDQKDKKGKTLLNQISIPKSASKKDPRLRRTVFDDPIKFIETYAYCKQDVRAETAVAVQTPDLSPYEQKVWELDQKINITGIAVDREALENCISIIDQAHEKYTTELRQVTNHAVNSVSETAKIKAWLEIQGIQTSSVDEEHVAKLLKRSDLPAACRRVLEIRQLIGAASVKKLFTLKRHLNSDNRVRDMFSYCGAGRTGRWAAHGTQPHNLPNSGPLDKWDVEAVEIALTAIASRNLAHVEHLYGDATAVVSGCLRGLFCAAPGYDLISSDYSAIEAVILAFLSGEQWRMDVFNTHGLIYEASASKITGIPFEEFVKHKKETGKHHPMRHQIGKFAELASGYGGGLGAWKQFGADKFLNDNEIKRNVYVWRDASPAVVAFWKGLESAAMAAIKSPGNWYQYRDIWYAVHNDVLYCRLLSGRLLSYHQPRIIPLMKPWGKEVNSITYMGWNSNHLKGPIGWIRMDTYGGKLTENVIQATARDILTNGLFGLDQGGYNTVLHVHDETAGEVPKGYGSIEEYERIMSIMPVWAADWPIKATGGWRGKRYGKY